MAAEETHSDLIWKARKKLTEALLQVPTDFILKATDSHQVLTQVEYFSLSQMKDPKELLESLVDLVLKKGEPANKLFLDCLENLRPNFPTLQPISSCLEYGPVDHRNESTIQSTVVLLENRAEKLGVAISSEGGNEVESLDLSVPSEAGRKNEKPNTDSMLSGTIHSQDQNPVQLIGHLGLQPESISATEPSSLTEGVVEVQSKMNVLSSVLAEDVSCSVEKSPGREASSKTATEGSLDSATISAKEMVYRGQNQLAEILQNSDVVFDAFISKSVITEEEYETLRKGEEVSNKPIWKLLILIQEKGEATCKQFLECLEIACPGANLSLQCSIDTTEPSSLTESVAEFQSKTIIPGSAPAGDIPCSSGEKKESLREEALSETGTEGLVDSPKLSADEIICKERKQLIEMICKDVELDDLVSQSIITEEEYEMLNEFKGDSKTKSRRLLSLGQKKGDGACGQVLKRLEIAYPDSNPILQHSVNEESSLQSTDDLARLQSTGNISESSIVDNILSSGETEVESKQENSSKMSTTRPVDLEPISSLEEMKEVSIEKVLRILRTIMAKTGETISSFMNYLMHHAEQKRKIDLILDKLELPKRKKFSLQEVLEISEESLKECTPLKLGDLPQHFLRKVLAVNVTARSTALDQKHKHDDPKWRKEEEKKRIDERFFFTGEEKGGSGVNPLDVLCAVLLSSDHFLQQQVLLKMSMCQFALPLLLPPLETSQCTLMLWAMRDIVTRWRPPSLAESRGFREESLVLISMPTISFVRLGRSSLSKSKLLNQFLSSSQQHHDFFVHRDMKSGNVPREIADGLEVSWYLPGEQKSSVLFPEAVAFANLRGDFESHSVQFRFLTQVSSAVFIFAEHIGEKEYSVLSSLTESSTQYYFIILKCHGSEFSETLNFLNKLAPMLHLNNSHVLVKSTTTNEAEFVGKLQSMIKGIITSQWKRMSVQEMAAVARELKIQVDEDCKECQKALGWAGEITKDIVDITAFKEENLKCQGDPWKNLAKVEKEFCRMARHRDMPPEKYRSELKGQMVKCRQQQYESNLTPSFRKFIDGMKHSQPAKNHYFLKWIQFNLDDISRRNKLQAHHKKSSLGVEHFMRELGQFYEAEHSVNKNRFKKQFVDFPSIAADLMLEGFPLELIDGDASNIPLQWITEVLKKVNDKLKRQSKMFVITVLGVQSTGKSTLLNTMFGLQFAVSSGRCTRGAFMTLLKVKKNLSQELGCDFVLVIDTEGLKAPELAKLEDSYQHDNELATLVIGLSDITIVNMAMENATEMKDILQIVTHAFLRMERIGQKPNCQFVHQNVSDVSAHDQNRKDRKLLLDQLNELTLAAAKMEKVNRDIKFSDIMDYDPETHNWYIPGLWHGVPPMASVNVAYSEKVFELKKYLFTFIRHHPHKRAFKDIPRFIEWMRSLWNAVKHENFIFSFRNSLIAEAYTNLSVKYSEWDWGFRRTMYLWVSGQETMIQNASPDELDNQTWQRELQQKLSCEEQQILENLNKYFESGAANVHLVEKYKEDFVRSANSLNRELCSSSSNKIQDAIRIKKARNKIDSLQAGYLKTIEGKVDKLLEKCRQREHKLQSEELKVEFDKMWGKTLSEISPTQLKQRNIHSEVERHLTKELHSQGRLVNEKLETGGLLSYRIKRFKMKDEYIVSSRQCHKKHSSAKEDNFCKVKELVDSLSDKCVSYIHEKVSSRGDYDATYCSELLRMIDKKLSEGNVKNLCTTPSFDVDLKLHILGEAAHLFQKMHEDFVTGNDPQLYLESLKSQYFSTFRDLYLEKDAQQDRAKDFCEQCLHPAFVDYVKKRLGIEIVDDLLNSTQSIRYATRSFFQFTVLKELLEKKSVDEYVEYIRNYEEFVKSWIWRHILDHFSKNEDLKNLKKQILTAIQKKVSETLKKLKHKHPTISECLDNFCQEMQKDLVISKDSLRGVQFMNMADPGQFFDYVENFLPDLQQRIISEDLNIKSKFSKLPVKPQDELFKRVFGCGKQCPFCKVPCEAGGGAHKEHFASVHRPEGLGRYRYILSTKLAYSLCSTNVASQGQFKNLETNWELHPYKDYQVYYPDWCIQPDPSINASDYWKFVFKEFNHDFAEHYKAKPADLPEDWKSITQEQALEALKETYNME